MSRIVKYKDFSKPVETGTEVRIDVESEYTQVFDGFWGVFMTLTDVSKLLFLCVLKKCNNDNTIHMSLSYFNKIAVGFGWHKYGTASYSRALTELKEKKLIIMAIPKLITLNPHYVWKHTPKNRSMAVIEFERFIKTETP